MNKSSIQNILFVIMNKLSLQKILYSRHHEQVISIDDIAFSSSWTSHLYSISGSSSWTSHLYRISCSSSWWNCMFVIPKNNLVYSLWKTGNPYKVSNILTTINRFTIVTNGRQLFCIRIYHFIFSFLKLGYKNRRKKVFIFLLFLDLIFCSSLPDYCLIKLVHVLYTKQWNANNVTVIH